MGADKVEVFFFIPLSLANMLPSSANAFFAESRLLLLVFPIKAASMTSYCCSLLSGR